MLEANLISVLILGLLIIIIYYIIFGNQIKSNQTIKEIWYYTLYFDFYLFINIKTSFGTFSFLEIF